MKIVIAGGRGFIGSHLSKFFKEHNPICLTRDPSSPYMWDPRKGQIDPKIMQDVDLLINLAGESVMGRWSQKKRKAIADSRYEAAHFLTELMEFYPPQLYIGASAMGYYGEKREGILTEDSTPGEGFLAEVCKTIETIPQRVTNVRQVYARFGLILARDGGALKKMLPIFRAGLGGVIGSGKQKVSWMGIEDVCYAVKHLITHKEISGGVNFVSKEPTTNRELTKTLGQVVHKKTPFRVPAPLLKLALGSGAQVLLSDLDLRPLRLEQSGFYFRVKTLKEALT